MNIQPDLSELTTLAQWFRAKDHLPPEAKRTVEALLERIAWTEFEYEWNWSPDSDDFETAECIFLSNQELSLRDCSGYSFQLTDLRPLASFTHLTSLDLNGDAKGCERSKLSDISLLSTFTNLTELDLSGNSITNLSPLTTLTELRELDLSRNFITDLTPLSALKNLTYLRLCGDHAHQLTESIDFSPLLALTQLKCLDLSSNKITDRALETIAQLTTLESLYIGYNRITDISPLASLPNLTHLKTNGNDITDFSPLDRSRGLAKQKEKLQQESQLTIRQPADLQRLATLTHLTCLKLVIDYAIKDEPWLDLTPLGQLTQLNWLNLYGCEIDDLTPLQTLTELTYLRIGTPKDLSSLKFLINLTELDISCSESLTDLSPLATLTKLTKLDITGKSQISDLSPLQGLTELTYLRCWNAKITDISPLASLTQLSVLNLVNNQITDLSPLRSLTNLRELYINGNPITDTSPLLNLPKLEYSSVRIQRLTVFAPADDPATPLTPLPALQQQYRDVLTQPIDRSESTAAVTAMYTAMELANPTIYFFDSPLAGVERYDPQQKTQIPEDILGKPIVAQLVQSAIPVGSAAWKAAWQMMQFQPGEAIRASLGNQIWQDAAESYLWFLAADQMVACGSDFDAIKPRAYLTPEDLVEVISVSQMYAQQEASQMQPSHYAAQEAMQQLLVTCGWIIPYEQVCIVCDRPRHVRLDDANQLHAMSEPAIEFADGWHSGYYHNGQLL